MDKITRLYPTCDFCGRPTVQVDYLIMGQNATFICYDCAKEVTVLIERAREDGEEVKKNEHHA